MIQKVKQAVEKRMAMAESMGEYYCVTNDEVRYLIAEVERLETKYHVDMNNYRSQVQTWQEEHDRQILILSPKAAIETNQEAVKYGIVPIDR